METTDFKYSGGTIINVGGTINKCRLSLELSRMKVSSFVAGRTDPVLWRSHTELALQLWAIHLSQRGLRAGPQLASQVSDLTPRPVLLRRCGFAKHTPTLASEVRHMGRTCRTAFSCFFIESLGFQLGRGLEQVPVGGTGQSMKDKQLRLQVPYITLGRPGWACGGGRGF